MGVHSAYEKQTGRGLENKIASKKTERSIEDRSLFQELQMRKRTFVPTGSYDSVQWALTAVGWPRQGLGPLSSNGSKPQFVMPLLRAS